MNTFLKIIPFLILAIFMGCPKRLKVEPVPTVTVVTAEIEIIDSNIFNQ
mgnify:FL=1